MDETLKNGEVRLKVEIKSMFCCIKKNFIAYLLTSIISFNKNVKQQWFDEVDSQNE